MLRSDLYNNGEAYFVVRGTQTVEDTDVYIWTGKNLDFKNNAIYIKK